ncbi:phosphoribosyl-ATP diphosphatase [Candidatus Vidania fulgoroideorum]
MNINKIYKRISKKIFKKDNKSYSYYISKAKNIKRKIMEESFEYVCEIKKNNEKKLVEEFCDLLYHMSIPIIKYKIKIKKILKEIYNRF